MTKIRRQVQFWLSSGHMYPCSIETDQSLRETPVDKLTKRYHFYNDNAVL